MHVDVPVTVTRRSSPAGVALAEWAGLSGASEDRARRRGPRGRRRIALSAVLAASIAAAVLGGTVGARAAPAAMSVGEQRLALAAEPPPGTPVAERVRRSWQLAELEERAGTSLVAHAWVEFHDGQAWHEVDPTAGRISVDASYIDASVMDLLPLLTDGRVEVTAIE